jgi:MFS family permease
MGFLLKTLKIPLISLILTILGSGLFTTFVSIRMELLGASNELIGIVVSAFYGGILLGSLLAPRWILYLGHLRALILCSIANTLIILSQAIWIDPTFWICLRFLGGLAMGGLFVIIESWFLIMGTKALRSQALSLYLAVFYGALSLGQLMLHFVDPLALTPFCLSAFLSALAILPIAFCTFPVPVHTSAAEKLSFLEIFHSSPRGFAGGIISGMLLACIYGLAPAYGKEIGLTVSEIGTFMSVIVFGGLSLQWPLGKWADSHGRRGTLIFACLASALFSYLIATFEGTSFVLIFCWLFGGFSFVIYPLSMAFTCEGIRESQIVAATGGFVLSYGIGAILGPLLAPLFMAWMGSSGLFYFLSGICLLLGAIEACPSFGLQGKKEE